MSFDQNFQVNLGGVIRLLSDHLYSGPEVYLRELMQNGVDAITARQQLDPTHEGSIRIEVLTNETLQTILVEDDGVGLTESEVHQFLATIGQSSKSGEFSRDDFIGQFGIGLLSGFVVSDEITVITKSAKDESPPIEWKGRVDGTYQVRVLDTEFSPGTRVYLQAKPGMESWFEKQTVIRLLKHFGSHLPYDISVNEDHGDELINEPPPWRQTFANRHVEQETCLTYAKEIFGIDFLEAIPLQSKSGDVQGYAFVLPDAASPIAKQSHRVYLKNMLLAESVEGLLPDWAFFVRCVVNANRLQPNAARDAIFKNKGLADAKVELGACLKRYLIGLAEYDRPRLDQFLRLHLLAIKALAIEDDEFLRLTIDWLPFETSLGTQTLGDYCESNSTIRFVRTVDEFRQIANVAAAQNICVFNAGYVYDTNLLSRMADEFPQRKIERVAIGDLVHRFDDLDVDEHESMFELIKVADLALQKHKCAAEAKKFTPEDLPTLFASSDAATFLRSVDQVKEDADEMWQGILDNVANQSVASSYSRLVLNYKNPVIRKLASIDNRELQKRIIEVLYLQSLLMGNYPLSTAERGLLGNGMIGLIDLFLDPS